MFDFSFACMTYLLVGVQVWAGMPPLYPRKGDSLWTLRSLSHTEILFLMKATLPAGIAMMIALVMNNQAALLFAGLFALLCGSRVRAKVKGDIGPLLPSIFHPFPLKWPLMAFDVWTVGVTVCFGLLLYSS